MNNTRLLCASSAGAILIGAAAAAHAQETGTRPAGYPDKPVRMLLGSTAGGSGDTVARLLAARMIERWGRQVIVDNRTGASGVTAMELLA